MPIARIIVPRGTLPPEARPICEQLREKGYQIEVVARGHEPQTTPDLELLLDSLPLHKAIARALKFCAAEAGDIYAAPGLFARPAPANKLHQQSPKQPHKPVLKPLFHYLGELLLVM